MSPHLAGATALTAITLLTGFQRPQTPSQEFAAFAKSYLGMGLPTNWERLEKIPGFKWAALPPAALHNCLPNGDCFARQGTATIGGKNLTVVASGARTMVMNLLLRNISTAFGEAAVVDAFKEAGLTADLARCPVGVGTGTSWYRLKGDRLAPGFLAIHPAGSGRPNEGFVVSEGDDLPTLQPNQLALYTEQCAPGSDRKPASTARPHESIASAVVALLVPAAGPALYGWDSLTKTSIGIRWSPDGPKPYDLRSQGDPNPNMLAGEVGWGGRKFSVMATGTPTHVKTIHLEEQGLHPKGEHMLGVVYEKGIAVRLVRCGPVYTESTNNWYSLSSATTRLANIKQSIRYDGNQVQDNYELRLDGTLPPRDPRDRNPGANGC